MCGFWIKLKNSKSGRFKICCRKYKSVVFLIKCFLLKMAKGNTSLWYPVAFFIICSLFPYKAFRRLYLKVQKHTNRITPWDFSSSENILKVERSGIIILYLLWENGNFHNYRYCHFENNWSPGLLTVANNFSLSFPGASYSYLFLIGYSKNVVVASTVEDAGCLLMNNSCKISHLTSCELFRKWTGLSYISLRRS